MLSHRSYTALDGADYGWLKAKWHFAVNTEGNPAHAPIGSLVVWNDDTVAPGQGLPLHGHKDMEIITYVRQGVLAHSDSQGSEGQLHAGDVLVMSAGTGIRHAEFNPGDVPLKVFQIWILPDEPGGQPRWETKSFPKSDRADRFVVLASGVPGDIDALPIRASARVLGMTLRAGHGVNYELQTSCTAYLVAARGSITVNGEVVGPLDGVAVAGESSIRIVAIEAAEIVMVETG